MITDSPSLPMHRKDSVRNVGDHLLVLIRSIPNHRLLSLPEHHSHTHNTYQSNHSSVLDRTIINIKTDEAPLCF